MEKKDIESVRRIFETQIANGARTITLNALMFQELLEHAENNTLTMSYRGKFPVGRERDY